MIPPDEIATIIRSAFPDAVVEALDRTGTRDHYNVRVVSKSFEGLAVLDRHRAVYTALREAFRSGRLHAVELVTDTPPSR